MISSQSVNRYRLASFFLIRQNNCIVFVNKTWVIFRQMVGMSFPQSNAFQFKSKQERFLWPKCSLCGLCVPSKGFTCEKCPSDVSFTYEAQLYVHMRDVHKVAIPRIIICELCDASFSNTDDLLEHILIEKHSCFSEHLPCPISTGNCLTLFETQDDLDDHINSRHGKSQAQERYNTAGASTGIGGGPNANATNFIMHTAPFVSVNLNSNYLPPQGAAAMNPAAAAAHQPNYNYMGYYNQARAYQAPMPQYNQYASMYNAFTQAQHAQANYSPPKYTPFAPKFSNPTVPPLQGTAKPPMKVESKFKQPKQVQPRPKNEDLVKDFERIKSNRVCYLCDTSVSMGTLQKTVATCPSCNKKFAAMTDVIAHMIDYHKEFGPIPVKLQNATTICGQPGCLLADSPMNMMAYTEHMRVYHPKKPDECRFHYVCEHCYQLFGSHGSLAGHHGVKGMKCSEKLDNTLAELLQCETCNHMCSPYGYTKCNFCQARVADEREALFHIQEKHTGVVAKFKKYSKLPPFSTKCAVHFMCCKNGCRKIFSDSNEMTAHQRSCYFKMDAFMSEKLKSIQENALRFINDKGTEKTVSSGERNLNSNTVSTGLNDQEQMSTSLVPATQPLAPESAPDETSYECAVCGFLEIFEEKSLKTCKYCSSNFLSDNDIAIHMAVDHESLCMLEDNPKLVCDVEECNSSSTKVEFDTIEELVNHRKEKHSKYNRCLIHYICLDNSCGRLFGARLLLKSHESAKLKKTSDENSSSAPIFCPDCMKTCDKSEVHSCAWCSLNVAGDIEMLYHVQKEHPLHLSKVHMCRFHCNTGNCDDYFNLQEYVSHRKSQHKICTEHYACLQSDCDAQVFSSAKAYTDHEAKCSRKGDKSPTRKQKDTSAKNNDPEDEPLQKKSKVHEESSSSSKATSSKTCSPVKESSKQASSSSSSDAGNVGTAASKTWDDLMDKMLSYTNSLM